MGKKISFEMQNKTIRKVFKERDDFIIIGLTGAIGEGLKDIANIMQKNFNEFYLPEYSSDGDFMQQLEYSNVYTFAKKHWKTFDLIRARDIIITYILENPSSLDRFYSDTGKHLFREQEFMNGVHRGLIECKKHLDPQHSDMDREIFDIIDRFVNKILSEGLETGILKMNAVLSEYIKVLRSKDGSLLGARTDLTLYVYTKYILPIVGNLIKKTISENYVRLFQRYGNEIRFFGTLDILQWKEQLENIENSEAVDYCYSIAKRINTFIKIRRSPKSNQKSVPVRIVIESLKNPYEFSFLKDRYSAYYTFAMLSKGGEEHDDSRFAEKNHKKLLEAPNLVKKGFKEFVRITAEILSKKVMLPSDQTSDYVVSLTDPEKFIQYIYEHLPKDGEKGYTYEVVPPLEDICYADEREKYEQSGIREEEFRFYLEILKDPVRAFCMVSDLFPFYLQDIQNATQNADVFLSNTDQQELTYKIVRYVSLIMHPGLVPPTKEERCMQVAFSAKVNSGCVSRQVGAVVTDKDYNILSLGWNDVHCERVPCVYRNLRDLQKSHNHKMYSDLELRETGVFKQYVNSYDFSDLDRCDAILDGLPSAYCFKSIYNELMHGNNPDYSRAIHAEARAFWACNKELARGGCLFTTSSSCENCTILANEYGIKNIYYIEKYAGIAQEHVATSGAPENRAQFILFEGAIGNAYMKMYTPVMPIKDELMLRGIRRMRKRR